MSKPVQAAYGTPEWEAEWRRKGERVRRLLGEGVFDPWERLASKAARGLDIQVEARGLEQEGVKPTSEFGIEIRARYLVGLIEHPSPPKPRSGQDQAVEKP